MRLQPLFLLSMVSVSVGLAQSANPVSLTLQQSLVTTVKDGDKTVEKLMPSPKSVLPGAVLSQVVTARNQTNRSFNNVVVKLPVPKGTVYLGPEKMNGALKTEYSIDGGKTYAPAPLKRKVTVTENGKSVTREVEVSPNEYQAVRWILPSLAGGAEQKVGMRIKVK